MKLRTAVLLLIVSGVSLAQKPSLDVVLAHLQTHLNEYRETVPDLFCSEHVNSSVETRRTIADQNVATVTDSIFRLRKTVRDDHVVVFKESRVVQMVNGQLLPQPKETISGPTILSGVFSDGLHIVSREVKGCYAYTLQMPREGHPKDKIVVTFKDVPVEGRPSSCPPFEGTSGQATIDPGSMHVLKLEKNTPYPKKYPEQSDFWQWMVEYAPVKLANKTFWMPKTIRATSQTQDGGYVWSFSGDYREYHLFAAKARIVPETPQGAN